MGLPTFVVPLISGLTAIGGTAAQAAAARRAEQKQAMAMHQERMRQKAIQEEQRQKALESLGEFETGKQKKIQDEIVGRNLKQVSELISKSPSAQSFRAGSAPEVIGRQFKSEQAKGEEQAGAFAEALARFGAQGQALQRGLLTSNANAQAVDRLGRDALTSSGLLGIEMENARRMADSPFGNALVGIGQAGLAYGIGGGAYGKNTKAGPAGYDKYGFNKRTGNVSKRALKKNDFVPLPLT
jgi:hypothetical protein